MTLGEERKRVLRDMYRDEIENKQWGNEGWMEKRV